MSTASTQLLFVRFLPKQVRTFMLGNIVLFKILELGSVGVWGFCLFVLENSIKQLGGSISFVSKSC